MCLQGLLIAPRRLHLFHRFTPLLRLYRRKPLRSLGPLRSGSGILLPDRGDTLAHRSA